MYDIRGQLKDNKTVDIEKFDFKKDKFVANGKTLKCEDFNYFIIRENIIAELIDKLNAKNDKKIEE